MLHDTPAKGLHYLLEIFNDWKQQYHTNSKGEVIFQNKYLRSNVRFNEQSLHQVQKHSRGFENIPVTIEKPDEIWMSWADPHNQLVVLRNYIKFGKVSFVVQTRDGLVTDAFAVSNTAADRYRKGVVV